MMKPSDFAGNVAAHLRYAAAVPPSEGVSILRHHLKEGTWRKEPSLWLDQALGIAEKPGAWTQAEAVAELVAALERSTDKLPDAEIKEVWDLLPKLARHLASISGGRREEMERLQNWFLDRADAGHANIAANMLDAIWQTIPFDKRDGVQPVAVRPLVEWLLQNGSAELKRPERSDLVHLLVDVADAHSTPELADLALRFALLHNAGAGAWARYRGESHWGAVERSLERGNSPTQASDLVLSSGVSYSSIDKERLWLPLVSLENRFPLARRALLEALSQGTYSSDQVRNDGWHAAFRCAALTDLALSFSNREEVHHAIRALVDAWPGPDRLDTAAREALVSWSEILAMEQLHISDSFGSGGLSAVTRDALRYLAGREPLCEGLGRALARELRAHSDNARFALAVGILKEVGAESPQAVTALLEALPKAEARSQRDWSSVDLGWLKIEFNRLALGPWTGGTYYGVRPSTLLIAGVTEIAFQVLENESEVQIDGNRILLNSQTYQQIVGRKGQTDEALALATVFFLHELTHEPQGIRGKERVRVVRATGSEQALLHLDLAADHAACLMTAAAFPKFDLVWIKGVLSDAVAQGFKVGKFHTEAARARKAGRFIGDRVDYLARRHNLVPSDQIGDGYLFADWGPAGGNLLVLTSGPPFRLVSSGPLNYRDAMILSASMDRRPGRDPALEDVDKILLAHFGH